MLLERLLNMRKVVLWYPTTRGMLRRSAQLFLSSENGPFLDRAQSLSFSLSFLILIPAIPAPHQILIISDSDMISSKIIKNHKSRFCFRVVSKVQDTLQKHSESSKIV